MKPLLKRLLGWSVALLLVIGIGGLVLWRLQQMQADGSGPGGRGPGGGGREAMTVPIEAAPIEIASIEDRRTLSGTLAPAFEFTVAPKIDGRIRQLTVDLGDEVKRGQIIARLDDEELKQAAAQSRAELAVSQASAVEAQSTLASAQREFDRTEALVERGIASEARKDEVVARLEAATAQRDVAEAQVARAAAAVEAATIRLGYTTVQAEWPEGGDLRFVVERHVDAGDTVSAREPIVTVADIETLRAVVFVTEKDYGRVKVGMTGELHTDAVPGRSFPARVSRLSPRFNEGSRQARVELTVDNADHALKPGMFVRLELVLQHLDDVTTVPAAAITRRGGQEVVFIVEEEAATVRIVPVQLGVAQGDRVQVIGEGLSGRVVVLGQQLLGEGSKVRVVDESGGNETEGGTAAAETEGDG